MNIIEVKDLRCSYNVYDSAGNVCGRTEVLKGINLTVPKAQFLAVLGHNGSGKSTLAKHFNGIITPPPGAVTVAGFDASEQDTLVKLRRSVGMVFQNPDNQIVATIVEDDVAFAPENLGIPPDEIRRRVADALTAVGMLKYAKHAPHHLSGGQKQRVAIAGVIAMSPECIVLDEPTAMLDPQGRREVMETVKQLNARGITVVLITHYMEEAAQAHRVVVMDSGSILMDGAPAEVFSRARELAAVGLSVPPVTEFSRLLACGGIDVGTVIGEEECAEAVANIFDGLSVSVSEIPVPEVARAAEKSDESALSTNKVSYRYGVGTPFEVTAVNGVTIDIKKGEFIGIMGHTGSGKSTLIQHFNGLLKQSSGDVYVSGRNIWDKSVNIRDIRFEVGLVFQYSEHQLFEETVFRDIAYGPRNMGLSEEEIDSRVRAAAAAMEIGEDWLTRSPFDLSGGEKRRVALAGVIAMRPSVLILDEPAAGLDPAGREQVLAQISKYHRESGITVLLVSHSMEDIVKNAQRVLVMNGGGVFCFESTGDVFEKSREIEKIGLDVPQITRVANRLCEKGINLGSRIYTADELARRVLQAAGKS